MAHSLTITYGTVTVDLNSGAIRMMEQYVPRMGDGETTVDGVQLEFSGTAAADINASIASITKAMTQAVRYNSERVGDPVFLKFQPDGYASAYSSELVPESSRDWSLTLDNDSMGTARWGGVSSVRNYQVQGYLNWKRRDWWDGKLATLTISNPNGTATTGVNVFNCNDLSGSSPTKRCNYFDVTSEIVGADLPSPILLTLDRPGGTVRMTDLWISANHSGALSAYQDFSGTALATASGGSVLPVPFTTSYNIVRAYDGYPQIFYDAYGNMPVGLLARFGSIPPSNVRWTQSFAYQDYTSDEFVLSSDSQLQVIGVYSPVNSRTAPGNYTFITKAQAAGTVLLDFIAGIPMNNYARIHDEAKVIGLDDSESGYYLTYKTDGAAHERLAVRNTGDSDYAPIVYCYDPTGPGVYLYPNKRHRFTLHWAYSGTCTVSEYITAILQYYPRRRLI